MMWPMGLAMARNREADRDSDLATQQPTGDYYW